MTRFVGLTGGIASGKSTVSRLIAQRGVRVVDADDLAKNALAPGSQGFAQVVEAFGDSVLGGDGALDRKALGRIIFNDAEQRRVLNGIVHPQVAEAARAAFMKAIEDGLPAMVYDVPLLYENGLDQIVDATLVVWVDAETQLERLTARDAEGTADAEARIASQMSLDEKRGRADFVLDNSGSLEDTEAQLDALWPALFGQSSAQP